MSTQHLYPLVIGVYSAILGFFIPSGGGKWLLEAPYVMQAANELQVHLGWSVMIYNAAEALPNLINPLFMLPLLGIVKLKIRDIVGLYLNPRAPRGADESSGGERPSPPRLSQQER